MKMQPLTHCPDCGAPISREPDRIRRACNGSATLRREHAHIIRETQRASYYAY